MKAISAAIIVLAGAVLLGASIINPNPSGPSPSLPAIAGTAVMAFGLWHWHKLIGVNPKLPGKSDESE